MHDGPAQSLTNIVLQAQIVERLVATDPAKAGDEVRQLVAMVQQTLEATKSFIFDVRPMVLDDLGLVPTLRRAARERGRRAGVPVEFDSLGPERRLPMDLESGLFRILDEAMAAYLGARAERVSVRLDWSDQLEARVSASRATAEARTDPTPETTGDKDLPPALAAMMEDRRADARDAVEAATRDAIVVLPPSTWREIQSRAATLGLTAELSADGAELRLVADRPPSGPPRPGPESCAAAGRPGPRRVRADPGPDRRVHGAHPGRLRWDAGRRPRGDRGTPSTPRPAADGRQRGSGGPPRTISPV